MTKIMFCVNFYVLFLKKYYKNHIYFDFFDFLFHKLVLLKV